MTTALEAVYESGVFRPLDPVELPEGEHVWIVQRPPDILAQLGPAPDPQKAAQILAEIAAMPMESGGEDFSGQDHDRILYGEKGAR